MTEDELGEAWWIRTAAVTERPLAFSLSETRSHSTALLRNGCREIRARAVRLVRKLHQQFRSKMMVTWVRVVMMAMLRSGWVLDLF